MMITEHNCEEYFLLYIDNELSAAERKAVEDFVANHPQHSDLFIALQQAKLPADDQQFFFNKEALLKDEASEIGINNYEEYFLLYTDNELTGEQKETTERFVLQHPQLQEEFTVLQQTKLPPEVIEYRNKPELYKKERRVVPFYIAGLSVAAAVFTVLFFTGVFVEKPYSDHSTAVASVKPDNAAASQPEQKQGMPDNIVNHPAENHSADVAVDQKPKDKIGKDKAIVISKGRETQEDVATQVPDHNPEEIAVVNQPEKKQATEEAVPAIKTTARQVSILKPLEEVNTEETNAMEALSLTDNNAAQPAVYKEVDTDDDNHTLYVSGIQLNKNKVNGILKSASRLLGGKSRQNDE